MCSFPPFPLFPSFLSQSSSGRICFFTRRDLRPPSPSRHPLLHSPIPPPAPHPHPPSSPSLSWVLDGGLSPSKNHYSNFLCNMNDSDPLFILELLITTQPIAYPPRQASHSHSRHYFITRVRLRWASMTAAVIRCGACGGRGPSSEIGAGCISTAASE